MMLNKKVLINSYIYILTKTNNSFKSQAGGSF